MANNNCLKGMGCSCGSAGPFRIVTLCYAVVHDDGIDETSSHEWDDKSTCVCVACGKRGAVKDFKHKKKGAAA